MSGQESVRVSLLLQVYAHGPCTSNNSLPTGEGPHRLSIVGSKQGPAPGCARHCADTWHGQGRRDMDVVQCPYRGDILVMLK